MQNVLINTYVCSGLRLDLDPDVVAAMDEDFDYSDPENELEDNFMEMAMKEGNTEVLINFHITVF